MREISFEKNVNIHADGSCLVKFGNTHVLCLATIDEKVPHWLKNTGKGWVTAEYGMLPRSTIDLKLRPINLCISCVLPDCFPFAASLSILVFVDLGSIPYSAVTQPLPVFFNQ